MMEPKYSLVELELAIKAIDSRQTEIKEEAFKAFKTQRYDELYREYDNLRKERIGIELEISRTRKQMSLNLKTSI